MSLSARFRLPQDIRWRAQSFFEDDYSDVQVRISDLPAKYGAEALAGNREVVFQPGAYQPSTGPGAERLFHELAHLKQQVSQSNHNSSAHSAMATSGIRLRIVAYWLWRW